MNMRLEMKMDNYSASAKLAMVMLRLVTKKLQHIYAGIILKVHDPMNGHRGKMRRHKDIKDRIF